MSTRILKLRRLRAVALAREKISRLNLAEAQASFQQTMSRAAQLNNLAQQLSEAQDCKNAIDLSAGMGFSCRLSSAAQSAVKNSEVLEQKRDATLSDYALSKRMNERLGEKFTATKKQHQVKQDSKLSVSCASREKGFSS